MISLLFLFERNKVFLVLRLAGKFAIDITSYSLLN